MNPIYELYLKNKPGPQPIHMAYFINWAQEMADLYKKEKGIQFISNNADYLNWLTSRSGNTLTPHP